jgi:hypothetical protein
MTQDEIDEIASVAMEADSECRIRENQKDYDDVVVEGRFGYALATFHRQPNNYGEAYYNAGANAALYIRAGDGIRLLIAEISLLQSRCAELTAILSGFVSAWGVVDECCRVDDFGMESPPPTCAACGSPLQAVRPGKWQCPKCE